MHDAVVAATGCDRTTAERALIEADNSAKVAIVMTVRGVDCTMAARLLEQTGGWVRRALDHVVDYT